MQSHPQTHHEDRSHPQSHDYALALSAPLSAITSTIQPFVEYIMSPPQSSHDTEWHDDIDSSTGCASCDQDDLVLAMQRALEDGERQAQKVALEGMLDRQRLCHQDCVVDSIAGLAYAAREGVLPADGLLQGWISGKEGQMPQ